MTSFLERHPSFVCSLVLCASLGAAACASTVKNGAGSGTTSDETPGDDDDTSGDDDDDTSDDDDDDTKKDAGRKDSGPTDEKDAGADASSPPPTAPSKPGLYINVDGETFGAEPIAGMRLDGAVGGGGKNGRSYTTARTSGSGTFASASFKIYPSGGGYPPVGKYPCSSDVSLPSSNTSYVNLTTNGTSYTSQDRSCTVEITSSSKAGVNDSAMYWNIKGTITGDLKRYADGALLPVSGSFDLDYSN